MDYLKGTNYTFEQKEGLLKAGTDCFLLGTFLDKLNGKSVLDIGCGTGAMLLYAKDKGAGKLTGVDINKEAIKLAKRNLKRYTDNFELFNMKIQDAKLDPFDVIVCNPPFFEKNQTHAKSEDKSIAMFDDQLSLNDLASSIKKLLKENGNAYIIYQADRIEEVLEALRANKLKVMKMQFVYKEKSELANRVLLKIKKGPMTRIKVIKPIII